MPNINDWAAKAAQRIHSELMQLEDDDLMPSEEHIAAIIREHYEVSTKYYVCTCWPAWNKECAVHGGKR